MINKQKTPERNNNSLFLFLVLHFFLCHILFLVLQVKSVKIKPAAGTNNGCGIDGELLHVDGQVLCSLLPEQCKLIGRRAKDQA